MSSNRTRSRLFSSKTKLDTAYFLYFILHIIVAFLIDSSLVIPVQYRTSLQNAAVNWHINQNQDFLLQNPPQWLVYCGWIEILVQLPLFFIFSIGLYKRTTKIYPLMVCYGFEAALTTVFCMVTIWNQAFANGLNIAQRNSLLYMYSSTFFVPLGIAIEVLKRSTPYDPKKTN